MRQVTKDQFSLVSEKASDIHEDNFIIKTKLFRQTFKFVELLRQSWKVSKATHNGARTYILQAYDL